MLNKNVKDLHNLSGELTNCVDSLEELKFRMKHNETIAFHPVNIIEEHLYNGPLLQDIYKYTMSKIEDRITILKSRIKEIMENGKE